MELHFCMASCQETHKQCGVQCLTVMVPPQWIITQPLLIFIVLQWILSWFQDPFQSHHSTFKHQWWPHTVVRSASHWLLFSKLNVQTYNKRKRNTLLAKKKKGGGRTQSARRLGYTQIYLIIKSVYLSTASINITKCKRSLIILLRAKSKIYPVSEHFVNMQKAREHG